MKKWVCPVCGYVHEGDTPPAECPVCHVPGSKFTLQAEEKTWAAEHVVGVGKVFGADVPVGTCADPAFLSTGQALCYTPAVAERFEHGYPPDAPQPDALDAFCRALRGQPDGSVTFVGIGPMKNIARFLADEEGGALMRAKVRRMVVMAGRFETEPPVPEWNVEMDVESARLVAAQWPGEVVWCGWEVGKDVIALREPCALSADNPVRQAYRLWSGGAGRSSWDLCTVQWAMDGENANYAPSPAGTVDVDERGVTRWTAREGGRHRYLSLAVSPEQAARSMEAVLAEYDHETGAKQ